MSGSGFNTPRATSEASDDDPQKASAGISGSSDCQLTPELLYKLNKKVAQLTKVSK